MLEHQHEMSWSHTGQCCGKILEKAAAEIEVCKTISQAVAWHGAILVAGTVVGAVLGGAAGAVSAAARTLAAIVDLTLRRGCGLAPHRGVQGGHGARVLLAAGARVTAQEAVGEAQAACRAHGRSALQLQQLLGRQAADHGARLGRHDGRGGAAVAVALVIAGACTSVASRANAERAVQRALARQARLLLSIRLLQQRDVARAQHAQPACVGRNVHGDAVARQLHADR
mmetsp:Transcript_23786/g.60669  ORF Transcript_23786/g.60669 Transcript_23786/m.60669 type:complete len:228 (-) Transcript_23786:1617-2300(-)